MSWLGALSESKPDPHPVPAGNRVTVPDGGQGEGRPGDDFSEHTDWADILEPLGAVLHHEAGRVRYWTRPGKDKRDGCSATTGHADDADRLKVFTPHWPPFADGDVYTKFGAYALLNHGGDHKAAAWALAQQGYGKSPDRPDRGAKAAGSGYEAPHPADLADAAAPVRSSAAPAGDDGTRRRGQAARTGPPEMGPHPADRPRRTRTAAAQVQEEDQAEEVILAAAPEFPHHKARGPLRNLLDWAEKDGLPVSFVAAAGEVAGAGAAAVVTGIDGRPGPGATLKPTATRTVLPILWQVLIGESGDGKNPSIDRALTPASRYYDVLIADWEARCERAQAEEDDEPPRPQALMQSSVGSEAIARWLSATGGGGLLRNGELASFLKGLGQYKSGGGSDRYDAMDMWSGESISIERVGQGGRKNAIQIYVRHPRLSIIGGLVPDNVKMLGSETDGLRARFLPALPSSLAIPRLDGSGEEIPAPWFSAIERLYKCQQGREWTLDGEARGTVQAAVDKWTARRREGTDPTTVRTALAKADEQCMRIALTVSELENPGQGGLIPEWAAEYAVARVDYALGCWLALGSDQTMAFSRKDEVVNAAVADLLRLIERRPAEGNARKWMTRRDIQRSQVGGATTSFLVDELIRGYLRAYPRTVTVFTDKDLVRFPRATLADRSEVPGAPSRGPASLIVWAPLRDRQDPPTVQVHIGETVGPDSLPNVHIQTSDREAAVQRDEPSVRTPITPPDSYSPDSYPPDSSPSRPVTGSHLRTVGCPSCGTVDETAVPPGERAYCKYCETEYIAA